MTKLNDESYPIYHPNGNITFTNFISETYDYRFLAKSLATYTPTNETSFGLFINRYAHSKEEVANLALDLTDALALRNALNLYIDSEVKRLLIK